ncbi:hypothetical protein JTE90_017701 [Oedothorax gibbosus]|uniref:EamA domain-containing protein n=1 Tax=Oedothorax gibbosus TaxID=931172 RepID=A0AAV6U9L4_9ARAC|nr:hypothetical protein JTE90_017701 [Oedothorax gibbosus]
MSHPWRSRSSYQVSLAASADPIILPKPKSHPLKGLVYIFLSSSFIMMTSVMVKKLDYIQPGQLSMVRNIGLFVGCLPIAVCCTKEILGPRKYWLVLNLRSLCGATALYLNLLAYRYLPLADASVIMSTTPSLVTIGARIYLKESCGITQIIAIFLTASGMVLCVHVPELITQRSDSVDEMYVTGICCGFGCVCLLAISMVTIRKMQDVHYSVMLIYFGALGTIENALLSGLFTQEGFKMAACGWDTVQVALIGGLGFLGHSFFTLAVQNEAAGVVSTLKSGIDIVLSLGLQVALFNKIPDRYGLGGAALVLLSLTVLGLRRWLQTLPDEAPPKKRLRFLLL